jgi:hypothetical protein
MPASDVHEGPPVRQEATGKRDPWAAYRGLAKWQLVLALLPLGLAGLGGALGGGIGAIGMIINLKIARRDLRPASKAALMLGVLLAAVIAFLGAAAVVSTALPGG